MEKNKEMLEKISEKKLIILISITLILIIIMIGFIIRNSLYKKYAEEAQKTYDKVHELYYFGGNISYGQDELNERIFIEKEENKYYLISNFDESVKKYFSEKKLSDVLEFLDIVKKDNNYYAKDFGRGISYYYGTTLKTKKANSKKRVFIAESKFCKINHQVSYGDGCEGNNEYIISKEFVIVKINDVWVVDKYTSIFEMDKEIK